jgi:Domain of Unknown Function (DUF928)
MKMKLMQKSLFFLAFGLTLSSPISWVQAQPLPNIKGLQISQKFQPRVDDKRNPSTDGGATRGSFCMDKKDSIIALNPKDFIGLTVANRPTFFWYQPNSTGKLVNFTIAAKDATENLYQAKLPISNQAGIIKFTMPEDAPKLAINQVYQWTVTVVCDTDDSSSNIKMTSWIERIEPDASLVDKLKQSNYRKLSNIYGEAGIWYDGLNALVQQRCTEPNNLSFNLKWRQYLGSVGLNKIVSKQLINSCSVNTR